MIDIVAFRPIWISLIMVLVPFHDLDFILAPTIVPFMALVSMLTFFQAFKFFIFKEEGHLFVSNMLVSFHFLFIILFLLVSFFPLGI